MAKISSPKQFRGEVKRRGDALYLILPQAPFQKLGYHAGTAVAFKTYLSLWWYRRRSGAPLAAGSLDGNDTRPVLLTAFE
jgi:hypothetical protein